MSDPLKHECGVAAIRLLKPLSYFHDKYGSSLWGFNKLMLLMEKQHNRGQDGAGIGCVKLDTPLGQPYLFRSRDASKDALTNIFNGQLKKLNKKVRKKLVNLQDGDAVKNEFDYGGEILMGHLRYGTSGMFDEGSCHPYLRRTNWTTRTLMVLGNFNMTNAMELNQRLIARGQHPVFGTDTQTVLEEIGYHLDEAHTDLYRQFREQGMPGQDIPQAISSALDIHSIINQSAEAWDGGFVIMGAIGNGDFFCLRDPHGIRPCHYLATDEFIAVASERVPLMSVFEADEQDVKELPPAHMMSIKADGSFDLSTYTPPLEPTPCSFEKIYFSRGNDPIIYRERKALGAALTPEVVASLEDRFDKAAITYIPNTAETAYYGLLEGLRLYRRKRVHGLLLDALKTGTITEELLDKAILKRWPRGEKIAHKDIKMRTFITKEKGRAQLVSHVYDLTYGAVGPEDVLVAIDDSIVRGTTLKKSILRILGRANPRKIVVASTAPQIRYPDCYGIDMSELGKFIAFQAAISLIKQRSLNHLLEEVYLSCKAELEKPKAERLNCVKAIYAPFTYQEISEEVARLVTPSDITCPIEVIFQTIDNLHASIEGPCGDWFFSGDYPTPGGYTTVNIAYLRWYLGQGGRAYDLPL
ncbi:MAG: amidophosphoribosyltransferase [Akkermansia sp.]